MYSTMDSCYAVMYIKPRHWHYETDYRAYLFYVGPSPQRSKKIGVQKRVSCQMRRALASMVDKELGMMVRGVVPT